MESFWNPNAPKMRPDGTWDESPMPESDWFAQADDGSADPGSQESAITDAYRQNLGRDPDPAEMASELENVGKYGMGQLVSNLSQRASSNGGGGGPQQGYSMGSFSGGSPSSIYQYRPFTEQFSAPTAEQVRNTPGYQAGFDQGQQALERSAAARGTLLTGGTAKALARFGQDYADQQYGDAYNRAFNEYLSRFNIDQANQNNAFNMGRTGRMDDFTIGSWYDQFNENRRLNDRAFGEQKRMNDFGIYNTMDTNYYNRLFGLSDYGQNATSQLMGANQNLSNVGVDTITGAGNAKAAGQVGSSNAWNQGLAGAGSDLMGAAIYGQGGFQAPRRRAGSGGSGDETPYWVR